MITEQEGKKSDILHGKDSEGKCIIKSKEKLDVVNPLFFIIYMYILNKIMDTRYETHTHTLIHSSVISQIQPLVLALIRRSVVVYRRRMLNTIYLYPFYCKEDDKNDEGKK